MLKDPDSMAFGETFLTQPDLFPARQSGERWGCECVVIRFAGHEFICDGLSPIQAAAVRARFGDRCRDQPANRESAMTLRFYRAAATDFIGGEDDWEYDFDLDYAPTAVIFAGFRFMGRLDWLPHLQTAIWTSEERLMVANAIFENVLRVAAAYRLLEGGGVLLHSAAVADDRGADVFFGPSGAGKSTIARLAHATGRAVLSDDMNALRVTPEGVMVEQLPFAGDFGHAGTATSGSHLVRNLCTLDKGPTPRLRPLDSAAVIAALLGCASFVNRNPYRFDDLLAKLEALSARLPVQALTFAPDNRCWDVLRGAN
jgi:hypothetical protein